MGIDVVPISLSVWLVIVLFWLVWSPFGTPTSRLTFAWPTDPWEVAVNLLLLVPLAIVAGSVVPSRDFPDFSRPLILGLGLLSAFIEAGQWILPGLGRVVSPYDVILNVCGGVLAFRIVGRLRIIGISPVRILGVITGLVYTAVIVVMIGTGAAAVGEFRLRDWDGDFDLAAGDEVVGGRAYPGQVSAARICAGRGASELCLAPGARVEDRWRLSQLAEVSQLIEMRAIVTPGVEVASGPARIVTFSADSLRRNATLAQAGDALVLRLRTPRTGFNADLRELYFPGAIKAGTTEVRVGYDRGLVVMETSSAAHRARGEYPTDLLTGWWLIRPGWLPIETFHLSSATLIGAAVLFMPIGIIVAWLIPLRVFAAPSLAGGGAASLLFLGDLVLGTYPGWFGLIAAALVASFSALCKVWDGSRQRKRAPAAAGVPVEASSHVRSGG